MSDFLFLSPDDTIAAFERRAPERTSVRWSEVMDEEHAAAFTVAKVAKLDLLNTIRASLDDVLRNGGTFEEWRDNLRPELERAGWWGLVQDRDVTGTSRPVIVGDRRLRTIFDTNVRQSMAQGHWARIRAMADSHPFLRYSAVRDSRTRPLHRLWGGLGDPQRGILPRPAIILRYDHPWWQTHFPPCGWRCRCSVDQLSQANLDARGLTVTPETDDRLNYPPRPFTDALGRETLVPAGIDPGFANNVAEAAHLRTLADKLLRSAEAAAQAGRLDAARITVRSVVANRALEHFLRGPDDRFPILVLDDALRARLDAPMHVATISADGASTWSMFRALADLPESATAIFSDAERLTLVLRQSPGWLTATCRLNEGGELVIDAVRVQRELDRSQLTGELVRGSL